jgi:hypothetical protein
MTARPTKRQANIGSKVAVLSTMIHLGDRNGVRTPMQWSPPRAMPVKNTACLRMAQHIREEKVAAKFRAAATQYFLRAVRGDMCATRFANWPAAVTGND